jgi:hypothetical protein
MKKVEKAASLLLQKFKDGHNKKVRDALRRLVLNHVDGFKIPQIQANFNSVSGKTVYRGLEELISIGRKMASW